jgi:hypothetical protein
MTPVVTSRCVVAGGGKPLAGLFSPLTVGRRSADPDSPLLGHHYDASGFRARPTDPRLPYPTRHGGYIRSLSSKRWCWESDVESTACGSQQSKS